MKRTPAAERNYKAFISYRHKPLDMQYAKKLHRRIERYIIPRDLRNNGEKKLGLVFRDQDELPISNNLDDNITWALDHSEYLIVICSPDTPESIWVQREISYFASHHDDDHILILLIDGTPEESFPRQLTEVRDEDGHLVKLREPLAANIVANSERKRNRLFQTESLRILAALMRCPYDALYRREHRYKMRRMAVASAAAVLIFAGFAGVLLERNLRIREQYRQVQIHESRTLAALSQDAFRDGNYRSAIESALDALPGRQPEREYVAAAESALSNAMYLYQSGIHMRYVQSMDQDTEIRRLVFSENGQYLSSGDSYGMIRTYSPVSGELYWETRFPYDTVELSYIHDDLLMATAGQTSIGYAPSDGKEVWRMDADVTACAGNMGLTMKNQDGILLSAVDLRTGEPIHVCSDQSRSFYQVEASAISSDGHYAAVLYSVTNPATFSRDSVELVIYDLADGGRAEVPASYFYKNIYMSFRLQFTEDQSLIVGCAGNSDLLKGTEGWNGPFLDLFAFQNEWKLQFHDILDFGDSIRNRNGVIDSSDYLDHIWTNRESLAVASKNRLIMLDRENGHLRWAKDLPGYVVAGEMYDNGTMGLVLSNGVVTMALGDDGTLSKDLLMGYFQCDYELNKAAVCGERYRVTQFAVVSAKERDRISMISFCDPESLQPFLYEGDTAGMRFRTSPSEKWLAGVTYNSSANSYHVVLVDPLKEHEPAEMVLDNVKTVAEDDLIFVTEDGKVLIGEKVLDPLHQTAAGMTADGTIPDGWREPDLLSCVDRTNAVIYTMSLIEDQPGRCSLYCWKDAQLIGTYPIPIGDDQNQTDYYDSGKCVAMSGSGYAVIRIRTMNQRKWRYSICTFMDGALSEADYLSTEEEETIALAETHPWIAVQGRDSSLRLMNVMTGEVIHEYAGKLPGPGLTKLLFAHHDEWLLAFTNGGELGIYSTENGTLLHRSSYSAEGVRFNAGARYDVSRIPEQNRVLIVCDDTAYREPFCISIHEPSFETNGFYTGFSHRLRKSGQAIILPYNDQAYLSPVFTVQDIQDMAERLLKTGIRHQEGS